MPKLSDYQRRILELYIEHGSIRAVCTHTGLAQSTVKNALLAARRATGLKSTSQLAYALAAGDLDES